LATNANYGNCFSTLFSADIIHRKQDPNNNV